MSIIASFQKENCQEANLYIDKTIQHSLLCFLVTVILLYSIVFVIYWKNSAETVSSVCIILSKARSRGM